jgi:type IV pilus assembly protein PilE
MITIKHQDGFTLIEMMITVAIVGILAAIAYPSYTANVQKSRRSDAQVALMEITQRQESYFLRNRSYANSVTQLGYSSASPDGQYTMSIDPPSATCTGIAGANACASYVAIAIPVSSKPQSHDAACQSMTLDNRGIKRGGVDRTHADADNAQTCWK